MLEKVNELGLPPGGTVVEMKSHIVNHVAKVKRDYERKGFYSHRVNFWDDENQNSYQFEAIHVVDTGLVYGACVKAKSIVTIIWRRDGYGIHGEASLLTKYEADWEHVSSIAILGRCLYASHCQGIDEMSLSSLLCKVRVIHRGTSYSSVSPSIASYKAGILHADPNTHRILHCQKNSDEV